MFWLLLSSVCTKPRTSHTALSAKAESEHEAGRGHNQDSWPKRAKRVSQHMRSRSVYKLGGESLPEVSWLKDCLSISQRVVSKHIVHHLFCIFDCCHYCFPFNFCPIKPIKTLPTSFTFFFFFFLKSLPSSVEVGEWASSCVMCNCQLGLNHHDAAQTIKTTKLSFS